MASPQKRRAIEPPSTALHASTDFHLFTLRIKLPLSPAFLSKPHRGSPFEDGGSDGNDETDSSSLSRRDAASQGAGAVDLVNQTLATMVMRYVPSLQAVLLAYTTPPGFIDRDAYGREAMHQPGSSGPPLTFEMVPGSPWGIVEAAVTVLGWRPTVGRRITGRCTTASPSHLSLLLHDTFNASIPSDHLVPAGYVFDADRVLPPAWNRRPAVEAAGIAQEVHAAQAGEESVEAIERGCWVTPDGRILGDEQGIVTFTVIKLTVAHEMISVTGSLLSNPLLESLHNVPTNPHPLTQSDWRRQMPAVSSIGPNKTGPTSDVPTPTTSKRKERPDEKPEVGGDEPVVPPRMKSGIRSKTTSLAAKSKRGGKSRKQK